MFDPPEVGAGRLDKGGAVIERLDERTENMRADVETIKGLLLKGD